MAFEFQVKLKAWCFGAQKGLIGAEKKMICLHITIYIIHSDGNCTDIPNLRSNYPLPEFRLPGLPKIG